MILFIPQELDNLVCKCSTVSFEKWNEFLIASFWHDFPKFNRYFDSGRNYEVDCREQIRRFQYHCFDWYHQSKFNSTTFMNELWQGKICQRMPQRHRRWLVCFGEKEYISRMYQIVMREDSKIKEDEMIDFGFYSNIYHGRILDEKWIESKEELVSWVDTIVARDQPQYFLIRPENHKFHSAWMVLYYEMALKIPNSLQGILQDYVTHQFQPFQGYSCYYSQRFRIQEIVPYFDTEIKLMGI